MSNNIIEVLEPYEDEVLYSWIVRMVRLYSSNSIYLSSKVFKYLFGPDENQYINLYLHSDLDYFTRNCGLPNSTYFKSEETMIETMSIIPFYYKFMSSGRIEQFNKRPYRRTDRFKYTLYDYGITYGRKPIEGSFHFKFCELCAKESNGFYLKREHHIPGNLFCYKHKILLKKAVFDKKTYKVDFVNVLGNESNISTFELNEKQINTARFITKAIHVILNAENSDYSCAQSVVRTKIVELLEAKSIFKDLEDIRNELNEISIISDEITPKVISDYIDTDCTDRIFTPILTLQFIYLLFGSLEEYEAYKSAKNL